MVTQGPSKKRNRYGSPHNLLESFLCMGHMDSQKYKKGGLEHGPVVKGVDTNWVFVSQWTEK